MASAVYQLTTLVVIFIHTLTGFGLTKRFIFVPFYGKSAFNELSVHCSVDDYKGWIKAIVNIQIKKGDQENPIANIDVNQNPTLAPGNEDGMEVKGQLGKNSSNGYLTLIIKNHQNEVTSSYLCLMDVLDKSHHTDQNTHNIQKRQATNREEQFYRDTQFRVSILKIRVENQKKEIKQYSDQFCVQSEAIDTQKQTVVRLKQTIEELKKKITENQNNETEGQIETIVSLSELANKLKNNVAEVQGKIEVMTAFLNQEEEKNLTVFDVKRVCDDMEWYFEISDLTCLQNFKMDLKGWNKSREHCKSFGGDLVIIRDQNKHKSINKIIKPFGHKIWIGIQNKNKNVYDFKYVDGTPLSTFQPWKRLLGYPLDLRINDSIYLNCVVMDSNGEWYNTHCDLEKPHICSISNIGVF